MSIWPLRIIFLTLCTLGGLAVSQVRPELIEHWPFGMAIGFGLGGLLIAIDEMLKGLSLRIFSAASFGLLLGALIASLIDRSEIFIYADDKERWLIRLALYLSFGYIGMILAMRSNKEDFSLIIPFVRFAAHHKPENYVLLDTSVIIDGRIAELVNSGFVEGILVVPRFVLQELQQMADAADSPKRARARRGLEILTQLQANPRFEVKIHEADIPEEMEVDAKLVRLARALEAKLFTNDYNLGKVAELQAVPCVNLNELATLLRAPVNPGDVFSVKIVREGKEKGQGVGFLNDGMMVVVNDAQQYMNKEAEVEILSVRQTGTGKMAFAQLRQ